MVLNALNLQIGAATLDGAPATAVLDPKAQTAAFSTGKTIRQIAVERKLMGETELSRALDARRMTEPQADVIGGVGG